MKLLDWANRHDRKLIALLYCLFAVVFVLAIWARIDAGPEGDEAFYVRQADYLLENDEPDCSI